MNVRFKVFAPILFLSFLLLSCNTENDKFVIEEEIIIVDKYYVKYIISGYAMRNFSGWYAETPVGKYKSENNDAYTGFWEKTYGTVNKGFKCSAGISRGTATVEIYVSKNGGDFIFKTQSLNNASYIIDF